MDIEVITEDITKLGRFAAEAKRIRHETVFPQDCQKAFDLGVRLAR